MEKKKIATVVVFLVSVVVAWGWVKQEHSLFAVSYVGDLDALGYQANINRLPLSISSFSHGLGVSFSQSRSRGIYFDFGLNYLFPVSLSAPGTRVEATGGTTLSGQQFLSSVTIGYSFISSRQRLFSVSGGIIISVKAYVMATPTGTGEFFFNDELAIALAPVAKLTYNIFLNQYWGLNLSLSLGYQKAVWIKTPLETYPQGLFIAPTFGMTYRL